MPHTIHKYPFTTLENTFTQLFPVNAQILKIECQHDMPTMWVLHNTNKNIVESRTFRIYKTGDTITDIEKLTHIGTFHLHNSDLIWHVFEEHNSGTSYIEDILKHSTKHKLEPEDASMG